MGSGSGSCCCVACCSRTPLQMDRVAVSTEVVSHSYAWHGAIASGPAEAPHIATKATEVVTPCQATLRAQASTEAAGAGAGAGAAEEVPSSVPSGFVTSTPSLAFLSVLATAPLAVIRVQQSQISSMSKNPSPCQGICVRTGDSAQHQSEEKGRYAQLGAPARTLCKMAKRSGKRLLLNLLTSSSKSLINCQ